MKNINELIGILYYKSRELRYQLVQTILYDSPARNFCINLDTDLRTDCKSPDQPFLLQSLVFPIFDDMSIFAILFQRHHTYFHFDATINIYHHK